MNNIDSDAIAEVVLRSFHHEIARRQDQGNLWKRLRSEYEVSFRFTWNTRSSWRMTGTRFLRQLRNNLVGEIGEQNFGAHLDVELVPVRIFL